MTISIIDVRKKSLKTENLFLEAQSVLFIQTIINTAAGLFFFAYKSKLIPQFGNNVGNIVVVANFVTTVFCVSSLVCRAIMVLILEKRRREIAACERKINSEHNRNSYKQQQKKGSFDVDKMGNFLTIASGYLLLTGALVITPAKILSTCLMFSFGFNNTPRIIVGTVDILKFLETFYSLVLYAAIFSMASSFFITTRNSNHEERGYKKRMCNTCLLIAYGVVLFAGNMLSHMEKAKTVSRIAISKNFIFSVSDALLTLSLLMFTVFAYNTLTFMEEKCDAIHTNIHSDTPLDGRIIVVEKLYSHAELNEVAKT